MASPVQFHYQVPVPELKNKTQLKSFLLSICKKESKKLHALQVIFCSDEYLLSINRQHLNHDFYTDIITFDYSDEMGVNGEIYISIERVRENARELGTGKVNELHRVIFHGVLHLCGYKDKLKQEKQTMSAKEDFYLARYFR